MPGAAVVVDNFGGARQATKHLLDHGHARIACLTHHDDLGPVGERVRGWRAELRANGRSVRHVDVLRSGIDRRSSSAVVQEWLNNNDEVPTALFAATDELAVGAMHGAWTAGRSVPDDLAVIGFDGVPERLTTVPELATITEPFAEMGQEAIEMLATGERTRRTITLPVELAPGTSCGC